MHSRYIFRPANFACASDYKFNYLLLRRAVYPSSAIAESKELAHPPPETSQHADVSKSLTGTSFVSGVTSSTVDKVVKYLTSG
jgi:hypothetical protein